MIGFGRGRLRAAKTVAFDWSDPYGNEVADGTVRIGARRARSRRGDWARRLIPTWAIPRRQEKVIGAGRVSVAAAADGAGTPVGRTMSPLAPRRRPRTRPAARIVF